MANSILLGNIRGQRGFSTKVQFSADAAAWHDNVETGDQYIRYSLTFDTDGNVTTWSNPSPLATTSVPVTTPADGKFYGFKNSQLAEPYYDIHTQSGKRTIIALGKIKAPLDPNKDWCCLQIYPVINNGLLAIPFIMVNAIQIHNSTTIWFQYVCKGVDIESFTPYKFMYNGEEYYGVEVKFSNIGYDAMFATGRAVMAPFTIEFYDMQNDTPINAEVYNSLTTVGMTMQELW